MRIDPDGKTAFVSGSTQGIGRAIAARLAQCGAVTYVNARTPERVDAVVKELRAEQPDARFEGAAADVSTAAGAERLAEALPDVDNLGIFGPQPLLDVDDETWQLYWEVNVMSAIRLTRAYIGAMAERGWGRVQFMASDSAVVIPEETVHSASRRPLCSASRAGSRRSWPAPA